MKVLFACLEYQIASMPIRLRQAVYLFYRNTLSSQVLTFSVSCHQIFKQKYLSLFSGVKDVQAIRGVIFLQDMMIHSDRDIHLNRHQDHQNREAGNHRRVITNDFQNN